ncbi:HNH endonuclease [compost metagenome]
MCDLNPCLRHPDSEVMPKSHRCLECISEYNEENHEHLRVAYEQAEMDKQRKQMRLVRQENLDARVRNSWVYFTRQTKFYGWEAERQKITVEDIEDLLHRQEGECLGCYANFEDAPFEIEHITPIIAGGKHVLGNLQLLCIPCNRGKQAYCHEDWISRVRHRQVVDYLMALENLEVE